MVGSPLKRIWRAMLQTIALALLATTCLAEEPKMVGGISVVAYNYSQESFALVKVNGKTVGTTMEKAKLGAVVERKGTCCIEVSPVAQTMEVILESEKGKPVKIKAPIEKWWPDLASTAIVHILPDQKVIAEIRLTGISPRRDLLEASLKELGLNKEVEPTGNWNTGPNARPN